MPRPVQAATSIWCVLRPVWLKSLSFGSRSMIPRVKCVRSRIGTTISASPRFF
jgi:hypothetical protein